MIDYQLSKNNSPYLVGDKVCFADLMFVTWNVLALKILPEEVKEEIRSESPRAWEWHQRLVERGSVKRAYEAQAEAKAKHG